MRTKKLIESFKNQKIDLKTIAGGILWTTATAYFRPDASCYVVYDKNKDGHTPPNALDTATIKL